MDIEEKRKLADELLLWLKEQDLQNWTDNSGMIRQFAGEHSCQVYEVWKAFELLRFCGRIIYNNPNGRKGAHVESFIPIQGFGAFPMAGRLKTDKEVAYQKAIESLAKYKFMMFGYWAAIWVHLNKLDQTNEPNPFSDFVKLAKDVVKA